jgi:alpha-L-fucosidase
MRKSLLIFCLCLFFALGNAQKYQAPADPKVIENLEKWGDKKFGLFMHWGIYSIPGIVESWSINSEDASWIPRDSTKNYDEYKKGYFSLNKQFNPVNFDPTIWARYAKKAGMQYVVFTTKHHDGFAMFDTKQSDYKITGKEVPFANHPKANITKEVFTAFKNEGFMIGAYFSKPDWHNENYWWPRYATPDRNNNYDIRLHPSRWNAFKQFTYKQIEELMSDYGKIDILWLDGGWVRPKATVNEEVLSWGAPIPAWDQDIDMPNIAKMARSKQPGLIIVDRTVHGEYENYQTPEQKIPEKPLDYPWETCMTMGDAWGYVPNDKYKSTNTLIHLLVDIVAKGGNFLLDIGPKPDGTLPETALQRLSEIGEWMLINSRAIYATKPIAPYKTANVCFTQSKNGDVYALYLMNETDVLPKSIRVKSPPKFPNKGIALLGSKNAVKWKRIGDDLEIILPKDAKNLKHSIVFNFY